MKILQLIQKPQRRGAEIFAIQLSEELIKLGHEVWVISIFSSPEQFEFSGKLTALNRDLNNRLFDLFGWKILAKFISDWQPDLVQANAADTLKFASFSKKIFRWNCPIFYRNANQMGGFIRGNFHRIFNQFLLNSVSGVISVSEASKTNFQKTFSFPNGKSVVIPIGIDPAEINSKSKDIVNIENSPKPFIIQIGGLVPEKDPLAMMDVFSKLADSNLNLIYLGSGPLEDSLRKEIIRLKLQARVRIIPNQTNIFPYLRNAKALVVPSKIEGLPAVILEALYCKIPVIAYDVGGIREVINERTGWLVPVGDTMEFIAAIESLLKSSSRKLEKITNSAFNLVNDQYSIVKISKQFELYYNSIK